jgi:16S rRNA (adenine1518-N6/adenine1519-N6)-dimethyltransferase
MDYSPKKMQEKLDSNSFNLKKKFGQNFIVDENIINSIITKSEIDKNTLVLEIGPGAGSLTYKLSKNAKYVLCYEIDNTLENILKENLKDSDNVDIKFIDFLKANVNEDLKNYTYDKLYVVANLPYYITTPIILKIIEDNIPVDKICVMVQKEVGDRFKATPGSKDYGSLSVYLNYYFDVKKLLDVSRNVFIPKPNVDSIVVEFTKKDNKLNIKNKDLFFKLVRDSFTQKRKTLRNNLRSYDLVKIENILSKYNLDLSVRAESLSLDIFVDIANGLED